MKECKGEFFSLNRPQGILRGRGFSARIELSGGNLTGSALYIGRNFQVFREGGGVIFHRG